MLLAEYAEGINNMRRIRGRKLNVLEIGMVILGILGEYDDGQKKLKQQRKFLYSVNSK
jgi:hypothetical protein